MFLEFGQLSETDVFDYCIVGSGPAGITCALGLAKAGKRVVLLEGGDQYFTEESERLYAGQVVGDAYVDLTFSHLRYFGGSSNHWGGWCRTLDEIDFKGKEGLPETGWPIQKSDLDPYLARTSEILEIEPIKPDVELAGGVFKQVDFVFSPPVNFAEKYGADLKADPSIAVAFKANLVRLETNGAAISGATFVDFAGNEKHITARRYILATGGIENSRLLLWFNELTNGQIVKKPQTLGRYWMDHPHTTVGDAIMNRDLVPSDEERIFITPTVRTMRENGILNCGLRVEGHSEHAENLIADIACFAPGLAETLSDRLRENLVCGTQIRAAWEMQPRLENRVALSPDKDELGIPRTTLYWAKSDLDRKTIYRAAELFGEYLAQNDLGRLRLKPWILGDGDYAGHGGNHHLGGTRMSESPETGIVDRNCKVFGQDNLYVAGSSVYVTSGHANPTMTIVQLTLRLIDHLKSLS